MYTLEEIEKYTNGTIVNGDRQTVLKNYALTKKHKKGEFFIPIIFHEIDREEYIIDSVKAGGIGFIINKNSQRYEEIIQSAKKINSNICIIEVEDVNEVLYQLGLETANKIKSRKIAVLGKLGEESPKMNEELGRFFENLEFDYLFTTGEYAENLIKGAVNAFEDKNIKSFKEKDSLY